MSSRKRSLAWLASAAALTTAALTAPVPASAAEPGTPAEGDHCVVNLSKNNKTTCFGSFTAAIAAATGGAITNAPADPAEAVNDAAFNAQLKPSGKGESAADAGASSARRQQVIGIEYQHSNHQGASYTFTGNRNCTGPTTDVDFWFAFPGGSPWHDIISSFRNYSNCFTAHYEHSNFTGRSTPYQDDRDYIGDYLNDRTSSLRWS
ncbi:hypothetical protein [Sinosporangium siamense]|uniref:Peptidase inhibitor family I36 n=1 Tax=Sinosporangium siamense TaxID=1367973 RepID=A0A919RFX3_9ACTN|nr:hypothetical protein [Sinosporangium siamense]GII92045.1 hypothetical protein Ssi02_22760 [Sinosporangium siamense]